MAKNNILLLPPGVIVESIFSPSGQALDVKRAYRRVEWSFNDGHHYTGVMPEEGEMPPEAMPLGSRIDLLVSPTKAQRYAGWTEPFRKEGVWDGRVFLGSAGRYLSVSEVAEVELLTSDGWHKRWQEV